MLKGDICGRRQSTGRRLSVSLTRGALSATSISGILNWVESGVSDVTGHDANRLAEASRSFRRRIGLHLAPLVQPSDENENKVKNFHPTPPKSKKRERKRIPTRSSESQTEKNGWKCLKEKKRIKWEEFEFDSKMEPKNPIIKSNRDGRQQKKIEKDTEDDPWRLICR